MDNQANQTRSRRAPRQDAPQHALLPFKSATHDRWFAVLIWGAWALIMAKLVWGGWALDLTALYFAAHFWGQGQPELIYVSEPVFFWVTPPEAWQEFARSFGGPELHLTPYVYPPLWAAVFAPLTKAMSFATFSKALTIVSLLSFGAMWAMVSNMTGAAKRIGHSGVAIASATLAGLTASGQLLLVLGQPQVFVTMLTIAAIWCFVRHKFIWAGAILALATALKLSPLIFILLFLFERNFRALLSFILVGGALGLTSVLTTGWPLHQQFLDKLNIIDGQVLISRLNIAIEQSIYHISTVLSGTAETQILHPIPVPEPAWIAPIISVVMLAGIIATWAITRPLARSERIYFRFILLALVAILTAPLSWHHYLVLPLMLLPGLFAYVSTRTALVFTLAATGAFSLQIFLILTDHPIGIYQVFYQTSATIILLLSLAKEARIRARQTTIT